MILKRKLSIEKERALKILDKLEFYGFISEANGSKAREVFLSKEDFDRLFK